MKPIDYNALRHMSDESRQQCIDYLDTCHTEMIREGDGKESLLAGLALVLQALGAEGYDFT